MHKVIAKQYSTYQIVNMYYALRLYVNPYPPIFA